MSSAATLAIFCFHLLSSIAIRLEQRGSFTAGTHRENTDQMSSRLPSSVLGRESNVVKKSMQVHGQII